jgi:hypothetical protein
VTFKFDLPSDGSCFTLDGDRGALAATLKDWYDKTVAIVCISGKVDRADFEACMPMMIGK